MRKGHGMRGALLALVCSGGCLLGQISGVVTNATTGKPAAGVVVNLIHPGENGMQTLGTATSGADGAFSINQQVPSPPALLQSTFEDVQYTLILQPGAPSVGVRVNVFNVTSQESEATLARQHLMILEPGGNAIKVTETFLIQNNGKNTFNDPAKGSVQFYVPKAAQGAKVSVEPPSGVPITRAPEKTSQADIFKLSYPAKPGDTVYEVSYTLPPSKTFASQVLGKSPLLLVTPEAVRLAGAGIKEQGVKDLPNGSRARVYEVPGGSYEATIDGIGTLQTEADESGQQQQEGGDSGAPPTTAGNARLYQRLPWVLGLTFSILGLGGVLLYRRSAV
jgi:hypothetical protein